MHPISFPQQNNVLGKPADMTDDQCNSLPVHHYEQEVGKDEKGNSIKWPSIVSCWQLTPEELEEVQRTGIIWVNTLGHTLAPFSLFTKNPFVSADPESK